MNYLCKPNYLLLGLQNKVKIRLFKSYASKSKQIACKDQKECLSSHAVTDK